jgi:hypothetical protein
MTQVATARPTETGTMYLQKVDYGLDGGDDRVLLTAIAKS